MSLDAFLFHSSVIYPTIIILIFRKLKLCINIPATYRYSCVSKTAAYDRIFLKVSAKNLKNLVNANAILSLKFLVYDV